MSRALTECPPRSIAVVPGRARALTPGQGTFLIGVDGSNHSARALRWAGDAASRCSAEVVVVHGFDPRYQDLTPAEEQSLSEEARQRLDEEWSAPLRSRRVRYQTRLVRGNARDVISRLAESIEPVAVVVGTRGLGSISGSMLGSVTRHLLRSPEWPIVVIPGPKDCHKWSSAPIV